MSKSDSHVNGFWTKFGSVLSEGGIDEEHAKFYLQWAEKFAVWLKGVPLRDRSCDDVRSFIADLRASGIEDWRVDQARDAIAILYRDHLKMDLSTLPEKRQQGGDGIRDRVRSASALEAQYRAVFDGLR